MHVGIEMDISTPRGTQDVFGEEMQLRRWIKETIRQQYQLFGFDELETPAFEHFEIFSIKGGAGEEIQDEIYYFRDKSNRELGLRFDLTVPLARFLATRKDISMPLRRYHIGKVWRYDRPSKGRYREFEQADADIVGVSNLLADAECIALTDSCLQALGLSHATIRLNSRKIAEGIVKAAGVPDDQVMAVFRSMDKLDKLGVAGVKQELKQERGIAGEVLDTILSYLELAGSNTEILQQLEQSLQTEVGQAGIAEVRHILSLLEQYAIQTPITVDLSFVRGLEYYTGSIIELQPPADVAIGSFGGGGRYDSLVGLYTGQEVPGIGISFGVDRVADILREQWTTARDGVFVATIGEVTDYAIQITRTLRDSGVVAEMNQLDRNPGNQFKYADSQQYRYVCVIGEQEKADRTVTVKDLVTGEEQTVSSTAVATTCTVPTDTS